MRKIGIEIETESLAVASHTVSELCSRTSSWVSERDGSLRGGQLGWEIKTAGQGLPYNAAIESLNHLYPILQQSSGVWRAAVHVHVDANNLTALQRALVLCLCYALDDSIFEATSPERRESNFCVPLAHKQWHVFQSIAAMLVDMSIPPDYGKYSSINIATLSNFGTFEFRHMRTPQTDSSIASVQAALSRIESFAQISHGVVSAVDYLPSIHSQEEMLSGFMSLVYNDSLWSSLGIRVNDEHVLEVLHLLEKSQTFNTTEYDLASIVRISPSLRGRPRMPPDIEMPRFISEEQMAMLDSMSNPFAEVSRDMLEEYTGSADLAELLNERPRTILGPTTGGE